MTRRAVVDNSRIYAVRAAMEAELARYGRKRKPPKDGWVVAELAQLAGVSVRTVRHYVSRGVLVSPEFFGVQTRYDRVHLLRLLVVPMLKSQGLVRLRDLRSRLDALGQPGLEQLARTLPLQPATRQALGFAEPAPAAAAASVNPNPTSTPATAVSTASTTNEFEPWQRLVLFPGLELMLRADATPFVRDIAERIKNEYAVRR